MINQCQNKRAIIPIHPGKEIKKPLLKAIIEEDTSISIEEFLKLL